MILSIISFLISPLFINIYPLLVSFIFLYDKNNKKENIIFTLILGLFYDVLYYKFYINILLFPFIYILIDYYFSIKKYNLKNIIVLLMFIIFIYNSIYFILLKIFNIYSYDYTCFVTNLLLIYILNIIYTLLLYLFIKRKNKHIIL